MVGFSSFNKLKDEIKSLNQLYDFTYHLYLQEHQLIKERIVHRNAPEPLILNTPIGSINHSLNHLYHYTKKNYPNKLRQLILINLITGLEVFFTDLIREIAKRDIEPFKLEEKTDYSRGHILNFSTVKGLEEDLLNKDVRKLTSGGLDKSQEYFLRRFSIDFKTIGIDFNEIKEIHERRHLVVHRNGKCDLLYAKTYPTFGFKPGDTITLNHEYMIYAFNKILAFAGKINAEALAKYPDNKRKIVSKKGIKVHVVGEIKLLVEFEVLVRSFDINVDLLEKAVPKSTLTIRNFALQYIQFEKRFNLYISAENKFLGKIMKVIKQNMNYRVLNTTEIDF